jgi:hypothetical protein
MRAMIWNYSTSSCVTASKDDTFAAAIGLELSGVVRRREVMEEVSAKWERRSLRSNCRPPAFVVVALAQVVAVVMLLEMGKLRASAISATASLSRDQTASTMGRCTSCARQNRELLDMVVQHDLIARFSVLSTHRSGFSFEVRSPLLLFYSSKVSALYPARYIRDKIMQDRFTTGE